MIKKMINEIKFEWKKNKVVTGFMGIILFLTILTYLKHSATSGILNYIGLSIINFIILALIIVVVWLFYARRKIK